MDKVKEQVCLCLVGEENPRPMAMPLLSSSKNPGIRRLRKVLSKIPLLSIYFSSNARLPKNEEAKKWAISLDHLIASPCKYIHIYSLVLNITHVCFIIPIKGTPVFVKDISKAKNRHVYYLDATSEYFYALSSVELCALMLPIFL